jgi:hypothetical protein
MAEVYDEARGIVGARRKAQSGSHVLARIVSAIAQLGAIRSHCWAANVDLG